MHRVSPRRLLAAAIVLSLGVAGPVAARQLGHASAPGEPPTTLHNKDDRKPKTDKDATPPPQADRATPTDYIALAPTLSQPVHPKTIRHSVDVEMADGEHLYVEVVRPDPKIHGDGPWPVILEASPYHGTLADRDGTRIFPDPENADGKKLGLTGYFAPRGYAVVMVDLRGTGKSSGCLDHLGPNDASDLKKVIEWAAGRGWSNGRVGMTGHSYVGGTQTVAAAQNPKGLATIVPSAGLASMYDHQFNKGVPWFLQWAGPIEAYEQLALERHAPGGDNFGEDMDSFGCGIPNSAAFAGTGEVTGRYEDWHAERDWRKGATNADIPIFMIHGIHDNAARIPAAEWYFGERFGREGDKVWLGQWDHGSDGGRCTEAHPTCRFEQFQYALHAWFDKHLAQRDVDTGPAVEVFLNGEKPIDVTDTVDPEATGAMAFARSAWTEPSTFLGLFPDATDLSLDFAPPAKEGSDSFGTVADAFAVSGSRTLEFTSAPLAKDTVLLGLPQMQLDVSMSYGQIVDVVTTLWREDKEGNRQQVSYCAIQPQLREGIDTVTPITAGEEMQLPLQCFTTAQWLPAGNKLVLEIGTTSQHHASRGSDAAMTLFTGPDRSAYRVPTLEGVALADDVRLHAGAPAGDQPAGPAQPAIHDAVTLPLPDAGLVQAEGATAAVYEFKSKEGFDNATMHAEVTDIEGDVDLWLDRLGADGEWHEVTAGANDFDVGEPETLDAGRLDPGTYRLRISNFASVPGEIDVAITFANSDGQKGPDPEPG